MRLPLGDKRSFYRRWKNRKRRRAAQKERTTYHWYTDFLWFDCQASTVINVDTQLNECEDYLLIFPLRIAAVATIIALPLKLCDLPQLCCWSCRSNYKHLERRTHGEHPEWYVWFIRLVSVRLRVWSSLWSSQLPAMISIDNTYSINVCVCAFMVAFEVCHRFSFFLSVYFPFACWFGCSFSSFLSDC